MAEERGQKPETATTASSAIAAIAAYDWFNQAAAGVVALIVSMLLGVFAPVFASGSLANS